jgi:hypothetical protein
MLMNSPYVAMTTPVPSEANLTRSGRNRKMFPQPLCPVYLVKIIMRIVGKVPHKPT